MSQTGQILRHLQKGPITPIVALRRYGCMRLAARVRNLRDRGYKISTEMVRQGDKRFAKYRLIA